MALTRAEQAMDDIIKMLNTEQRNSAAAYQEQRRVAPNKTWLSHAVALSLDDVARRAVKIQTEYYNNGREL